MKKVVVSVINDLVTDQRVHRSCQTLHNLGYDVLLVGRVLPNSLQLKKRGYRTRRMRLLFKKGPLFYAEFNVRLFLFLLYRKVDILWSNDLDTLLPNFLNARLRNKKLIYDSHEYFTEVPELVNRKAIQKVWKTIEGYCLTRMKRMITVNESIAELFKDKYGIRCEVIRNVPIYRQLKTDEKEGCIILQGAGINVDRGGEELITAMSLIDGIRLLVVGDGDAVPKMKEMVKELSIQERVIFTGKVPYSELSSYTAKAEIGLTLDKATNINYKYSLPNKLFDYLQAGCAIISSDLKEVKRVVNDYDVGIVLEDTTPEEIAKAIKHLMNDSEALRHYQKNALKASKELSWTEERKKLENWLKDFY